MHQSNLQIWYVGATILSHCFYWLTTTMSFIWYPFWNIFKFLVLRVSKTLVCHNIVACFQEKECLKLKKERDKKEDQLKLISYKNEEENAPTNCSKIINK